MLAGAAGALINVGLAFDTGESGPAHAGEGIHQVLTRETITYPQVRAADIAIVYWTWTIFHHGVHTISVT